MRVSCPGCSTSFNVDDGRVPPQGTNIRCPKCFKSIEVLPISEEDDIETKLGILMKDLGDGQGKGKSKKPKSSPAKTFQIEEDLLETPLLEDPKPKAKPNQTGGFSKKGEGASFEADFHMVDELSGDPAFGTGTFEALEEIPRGKAGADPFELEMERSTVGREDRGVPPVGKDGPSLEDIDFDSLLNDLPSDMGGGDTFFVDTPEGLTGEFEAPGMPGEESFNMEEINFDELEGLEAAAEAGKRQASPAAAIDAMELDLGADPKVRMAPVVPQSQAPLMPEAGAGAKAAKKAAKKAPKAPGASKSKAPVILVVFLLLLAAGAVGMVVSGIGDTILAMFSDGQPQEAAAPAKKTEKEEYVRGDVEFPTADDYKRTVEGLEKKLKMSRSNWTEKAEELLWVLAWYQMVFPDNFTAAGLDKRLEELKTQILTGAARVFLTKLEAMKLASQGSWKEAREKLLVYQKDKDLHLDQIMAEKRLGPKLAAEDLLLKSWIELENFDKAAADVLGAYFQKAPKDVFGMYLHARYLHKTNDLAGAQAKLTELLAQFPQHLSSKLLLAELTLANNQPDKAITLAEQVVTIAEQLQRRKIAMEAYRIMVTALKSKGEAGEDQLRKVLEKVVQKEPGEEDLVVTLARIYLTREKFEEALSTLKLCQTCEGADYTLLLVQAMKENKMFELALTTAQEALVRLKDNPDLLILVSELAFKTGRSNSAVDYLRDVLRSRPGHLEAALRLSDLYQALEQPASAREILIQAEKYHFDNLQIQEKLVQINLLMNEDSGAVAALRRVQAMKPDDLNVRLQLTEALVRMGNYKEALPHFDVLAGHDMIGPKLRSGYAIALLEVGRTEDAITRLKMVLDDNPSDFTTARALADIYLDKKDYFKARTYLDMARRSMPSDPDIHFNLGLCCLKLEDDACSFESFGEAVKLAPDKLAFRVEYAKILYDISEKTKGEKKNLQKLALEQFNQIVGRYETDLSIPNSQKDPGIYANRGQLYFNLGYYEKALVDFRRAVQLDSHRVDLLLRMGDSLFHVNRYSDAVKYYNEVLDTGGNLAHANFYLGRIALIKGNKKDAKRFLLAAVAADHKAFPDAHRFLGDIYKEEHFRDLAVKYYNNFLELAPPGNPVTADVKATLAKLRK